VTITRWKPEERVY